MSAVVVLQTLLALLETLFENMDMRINARKSACIRFGACIFAF